MLHTHSPLIISSSGGTWCVCINYVHFHKWFGCLYFVYCTLTLAWQATSSTVPYNANTWKRNTLANFPSEAFGKQSCLFAYFMVYPINSFGFQCAIHIYYSCGHEWGSLNQWRVRYHECKSIWKSPLNDKELTFNHWTNIVAGLYCWRRYFQSNELLISCDQTLFSYSGIVTYSEGCMISSKDAPARKYDLATQDN